MGPKISDRSHAQATVFRVAMAAGLLLALAANLPGHMTVDSIVALVEARSGARQTWAPAISSLLLKPFDWIAPGTGLYVTATASLLFISLMSLPGLRPRSSWLAAVLGLLVIFTPQLLIYQGIVWRDVLFANLVVAGFILLAHAAPAERAGLRPGPLVGALVCLSLATLARQNGLLLLVAAAAALGWLMRGGGRRAILGWSAGFLVAALLLALGVNHLAQPPEPGPKLRPGLQTLILQHYDVVGAKAHQPKLKLTEINRANPASGALLEAQSASRYTASRIDTLDLDPTFRRALWKLPDPVMHAQWLDVVLHHPDAYLLHRADVFRWIVLTPDLRACVPLAVGVTGPEAMLRDLDMVTGMDVQDRAVASYGAKFYDTPVYSHATYMVLALILIVLLVRRGEPRDGVMAALLVGALAFVGSFAVIGVACDYRYLYIMDLATITVALYAALDPPVGRFRPWRRSA